MVRHAIPLFFLARYSSAGFITSSIVHTFKGCVCVPLSVWFSCLNNPMGNGESPYFRDYAVIPPSKKLSHAQFVKKFTDFYGICGFTTVFTVTSYWTLSWDWCIHTITKYCRILYSVLSNQLLDPILRLMYPYYYQILQNFVCCLQ
jgi:hypothetical protein